MKDTDRPTATLTDSAEYEAARHGALVVTRTDRAFIRVFGREPVKMVQGLITNDMTLTSPTRAVYAGMLTPKGKLVADMRIYRRNDDVLIETAAAARQNVLDHLKKYVPPLFAKGEDVSTGSAVIGVYGPQSAEFVQSVLQLSELPQEDDGVVSRGEIVCVRSAYTIESGYDLIVPVGSADEVVERIEAAGAHTGGLDTLEVLRIEAGRPRWGAELDENVIPLEAGLRERMISEGKGCYTGQEVIIRILHRGHVNRQLRGARLGALSAAERGTELVNNDGKAVGRITSATFSPRFGETIALAYVRREVTPPATVKLTNAEGADVRIVDLPFTAA